MSNYPEDTSLPRDHDPRCEEYNEMRRRDWRRVLCQCAVLREEDAREYEERDDAT